MRTFTELFKRFRSDRIGILPVSIFTESYQMGSSIDIARMLNENEEARLQDAEEVRQKYDQIVQNDTDILKARRFRPFNSTSSLRVFHDQELQTHKCQMQEAMTCIHRVRSPYQLPLSSTAHCLQHLTRQLIPSERDVLEAGTDVVRWCAGPAQAVSDAFVITSLDVIIRYDERKLGSGGFASVYEGDWKGVKVAVKVFDKNLSASVSTLRVFRNLDYGLIMIRPYNMRWTCGSACAIHISFSFSGRARSRILRSSSVHTWKTETRWSTSACTRAQIGCPWCVLPRYAYRVPSLTPCGFKVA